MTENVLVVKNLTESVLNVEVSQEVSFKKSGGEERENSDGVGN